MTRRVDWEIYKNKYIMGDDSVTLRTISEIPGAPSYNSLKRQSHHNAWVEQRSRYRHQKDTQAVMLPDVQEAVDHALRIIDSAEMLSRHARAARLVGEKAIEAIRLIDPSTLKPCEAIAWLKLAVEIERITEGHPSSRIHVDLSKVTDEDLARFINGD